MKFLFPLKIVFLITVLALIESVYSGLDVDLFLSLVFRVLFYLSLYLFSYYVCRLGKKGWVILLVFGAIGLSAAFASLPWLMIFTFWIFFNFSIYRILKIYINLNKIVYFTLFVVLNLKILISITLSHWDLRGFVEFIQTYVSFDFANPWEHYYLNSTNINVQLPSDTIINPLITFPYPTGMLYLLTSFSLATASLWNFIDPNMSNFASLFAIRIPVIMADLLILYLILKWIKSAKLSSNFSILWFLSPIIGISSYLHGQLDLIPTALFCLMVESIRLQKLKLSMIFLTIGYLIKSYFSLIILPFVFYLGNLWKRIEFKEKATIIMLPFIGIVLLLVPFGGSDGYKEVLSNQVARNTILGGLNIPIGQWNTFPLSVAALTIFYIVIISNIIKINDWLRFMLISGAILILVPALTTSSIAWFTWALPAVTFFYIIKAKGGIFGSFPIIAFSIFYSMYFLGWQYSSFWFSFAGLKDAFPDIFTMKIGSWSTAKFLDSAGSAVTEIKTGTFQLSSIVLTTMNASGLYIAVQMLLSVLGKRGSHFTAKTVPDSSNKILNKR